MRISSAVLAVMALGACSSSDAVPDPGEPAAGEEHIACMVGGLKDFAEVCSVERSTQDGALTLVVRHPDGAFRRFDVLSDGRGLALADGADQAVTSYRQGFAEIAVGTDHYRFPIRHESDAAN